MEQQRPNMAPRLLLWLIVLAVLISPAAYLYLRESEVEVTVTTVSRGHVEQTVTAISSGTVMPEEDSMVASGLIGVLVAVFVREGERVSKGQVLLELEHAGMDAQIVLAKANIDAGESLLRQSKIAAEIYSEVARTRVSQAREQLRVAQLDFDRIQSLSDQRAVSQNDLDKVELALRVTQETLASALATQKENLVRQEEIHTAESNLEQLHAALAVAEAALDTAFVRAPYDGLVAKVFVDRGEAIGIGMPVLHLVRDSNCFVQAPFDEANASEISLGQKTRVNLDAYRGRDFFGEVTYISPIVSINPDFSRTLDVKIHILDGQEFFTPGMSADVTILVNEKENVLFVPAESLIRERFAYVISRGRAERRTVETGVGNWDTKEILSGLEEGDILITSVSIKDLADGVKVTVVDLLGDT